MKIKKYADASSDIVAGMDRWSKISDLIVLVHKTFLSQRLPSYNLTYLISEYLYEMEH